MTATDDRLYLRVEGPLATTLDVGGDEIWIGARGECQLALPDPSVRPRHARIALVAGRTLLYALPDAQSAVRRTGTVFVVRPGYPFPLMAGDVIQIGDQRVRVMPGRAPRAAAPRPEPAGRRGATRVIDPRLLGEADEAPVVERPVTGRPAGATRLADPRLLRPAGRESAPAPAAIPVPPPSDPPGPILIPRVSVPPPSRPAAPPPPPTVMSRPPAELVPVVVRPLPRRPTGPIAPAARPQALDPLDDLPTGEFSRAALQAAAARAAAEEATPEAVRRAALEAEVAGLAARVAEGGGAEAERRRREEQREAVRLEVAEARRRALAAERELASVLAEQAERDGEVSGGDRRLRELEVLVAAARTRRRDAEEARDATLAALREAEAGRDLAQQEVWTREYDVQRLKSQIENLEIALGLDR